MDTLAALADPTRRRIIEMLAQRELSAGEIAGRFAVSGPAISQHLTVLKAAGKSFDDVVRAGVFLTSMSDYLALNGVYAKHFRQPFPARTTIAAAALPLGARVEIDLVVKA